MLTRGIALRAEKADKRRRIFIISDETPDRHGTVIKMDGWDLDGYEKNGIVAYQHITWSANPDFILGSGIVYKDNGSLISEVDFEPESLNPLAEKVLGKIDFGSLKTASVGFNPFVWSFGDERNGEKKELIYFRHQELLEWSVVNIPSNKNAYLIERDLEEFVKMVRGEASEEETKQNETPTPTLDKHRTASLTMRFQSLSI